MMRSSIMADESLSVLTSASAEILSASSGSRIEETVATLHSHHSYGSTNQPPLSSKKKRSLPGDPDPEAEVMALSPKTLLATNRFMCEICKKGFQRDQNLQLHRRGHNLPWKLKRRTSKEVKKKVYICPEITCVHHDPSRALGDLTGIKKHFFRKHGEKKWKCEKCSKRYAVQSDWKAHSKICGTREYRCDCGAIFSRRDSFITHRAFCDALTQESVKAMAAVNPLLLASQSQPHSYGCFQQVQVKNEPDLRSAPQVPPWLTNQSALIGSEPVSCLQTMDHPTALLFSSSLEQSLLHHRNPNPNSTSSSTMSATALLQKATLIGATAGSSSPLFASYGAHITRNNGAAISSAPTTSSMASSSCEEMAENQLGIGSTIFGNKSASFVSSGAGGGGPSLLHDMMVSISGFEEPSLEETLSGMFSQRKDEHGMEDIPSNPNAEVYFRRSNGGTGSDGNGGGETRDFLGLRPFSHRDFINLSMLNDVDSSSAFSQHNQNQISWPS